MKQEQFDRLPEELQRFIKHSTIPLENTEVRLNPIRVTFTNESNKKKTYQRLSLNNADKALTWWIKG